MTKKHVLAALAFVVGCGNEASRLDVEEVQGAYVAGPTDDRIEVYAASTSLQAMAKGVPSLWSSGSIISNSDGSYTINGYTGSYCADEPFAMQPQGDGFGCSAFLIAPDLLATAYHCINHSGTMVDLNKFAIFGWQTNDGTTVALPTSPLGGWHRIVAASEAYPLSAIVANGLGANAGDDWALIRLAKPVGTNHPTLPVLAPTSAPVGRQMALIGYPTGKLEKVAAATGGAWESWNTMYGYFPTNVFKMDTDSYSGDSGAPVIDIQNGAVAGILTESAPLAQFFPGSTVSGDQDYIATMCNPAGGGPYGSYWKSIRCPSNVDCSSGARTVAPLAPYVAQIGSQVPTIGTPHVLADAPAVAMGTPYTQLTMRGEDDKLYYTICLDSSSPSAGCSWYNGWQAVSGAPSTDAAPSTTMFNNLIQVVVKEKGTNKLRLATLNGSTWKWSAWSDVGDGSLIAADSPAVFGVGSKLVVVARDTSNNVRINAQRSDGTWIGWSWLSGGTTLSPPRATRLIDVQTNGLVGIRTSDNKIQLSAIAESGNTITWGAWTTPDPNARASSEPNFITKVGGVRLMYRGTDDKVYYQDRLNGTWGTTTPAQAAGRVFSGVVPFNYGSYTWYYAIGADRQVHQAVMPQ